MDNEKLKIPHELINPSDDLVGASLRIGLHWWYWDEVNKDLIMSPEMINMLGYSDDELDRSKPNIYKNVHPDDIKISLTRLNRLLEGEDELFETEFRVKGLNGDWKWFYNRATVLRRSDTGEAQVVGGVILDMSTTHRQLKIRAENNERLYQTLVDAAHDPIGLFSVDKEMILINPAFYETIGYNREEFLTLEWTEVIHPEDRDVFEKIMWRLERDGNLSTDYRVRHKSGVYLFVSSKNVLIKTEGDEPDMILTIIRDVTERKAEMKELKVAKQKAEESDQLKSAFLANMSHEIRTPMNSIVGFSNLLVNPELNDAVRDMYVSRIVRNSELLLNLISDIIDLAKIESKQLQLIYGKQLLSSLLVEMKQYAIDEVNRLDKKEINVIVNEMECDCEIETDVIRLTQVMKNLINNAIKFTSTGEVRIGCKASGSKPSVILYVEDSGVGIDSGNFELIFDQFRQVDGSNTRKFGGTGLGLTICRNLVEMMGGRIWVESREGEGALFQLELPIKASMDEKAAKATAPGMLKESEYGNSLSIIVVDDEADSLELFHAILSGMGHNVITASSGYELLQLLEKQALPHVVFMDDRMPVLSGTETMRIVHERYPSVKIVAQSAQALVGDNARFLNIGFDAYLPKPFSIEDVSRILTLFRKG